MEYIRIEKYIENIKNTKLPLNYYSTRFHRNYINSLSLEDYEKWLSYLHEKKKLFWKKYREEHKEELKEKYRKYSKDEIVKINKRKSHNEWKKRNPERYKIYADHLLPPRKRSIHMRSKRRPVT